MDLRGRKYWEAVEDCIMRSFTKYVIVMKWVGHVAGIGEIRNAYTILVGKSEGRCKMWRFPGD
jgi:hypothetical protein